VSEKKTEVLWEITAGVCCLIDESDATRHMSVMLLLLLVVVVNQ